MEVAMILMRDLLEQGSAEVELGAVTLRVSFEHSLSFVYRAPYTLAVSSVTYEHQYLVQECILITVYLACLYEPVLPGCNLHLILNAFNSYEKY